jgi:D-3-phosphoglycerate dehydrogenase
MISLSQSNVLVAEPLTGSEKSIEFLKEAGCTVTVGAHSSFPDKGYTEQQLVELGNENDGFIVLTREKLSRKVLENCKRLKVICKSGSGVDNIDVEAATELGILVTNAPVNISSVAEYTIGLILALYKKIPQNERHIRAGKWRDDTSSGHDLLGKTVGLLGFGNIGRHVAQRLQSWDLKLIAHDPFFSSNDAPPFGVTMKELDEVLRESDIISLHMPLNAETRGMIGEKQFAVMKDSAVIINTARGAIIDKAALLKALDSGRLMGAALDNHEKEPIAPDDPLLTYNNVIISPHIAGFSFEALERIALQAAVNCINALKGEKPSFIFNPAVYEEWHKRHFGSC